MNPWIAKAVVLAASVALVAIRAPHGHRSRGVPVIARRNRRQERVLLTCMWIAFFGPLLWIGLPPPVLRFAEYEMRAAPLFAGIVCYIAGLWLFHRSHADLGRNWSITIEVRQDHRLVTHGVYRRIRHPMYTALLLYALGQALVIPNWVVGPSYVVALVILLAFRLPAEEQMMMDQFGADYAAYMARTWRLLPGAW